MKFELKRTVFCDDAPSLVISVPVFLNANYREEFVNLQYAVNGFALSLDANYIFDAYEFEHIKSWLNAGKGNLTFYPININGVEHIEIVLIENNTVKHIRYHDEDNRVSTRILANLKKAKGTKK